MDLGPDYEQTKWDDYVPLALTTRQSDEPASAGWYAWLSVGWGCFVASFFFSPRRDGAFDLLDYVWGAALIAYGPALVHKFVAERPQRREARLRRSSSIT